MRTACLTVLAAAVLTLAGCGGSAAAEGAIKDSIAAMNAMSDAMKAGDKAGVKKAAEQLKASQEKLKTLKVTTSEDKRLKEKYEGELKAAGDRMGKATIEGMGKFSPADMLELGEILKSMK